MRLRRLLLLAALPLSTALSQTSLQKDLTDLPSSLGGWRYSSPFEYAERTLRVSLSALDQQRHLIDRLEEDDLIPPRLACPGERRITRVIATDRAGRLRSLFLSEFQIGHPGTSTLRAYYDAAGELFFLRLHRRNVSNTSEIQVYVRNERRIYQMTIGEVTQLPSDDFLRLFHKASETKNLPLTCDRFPKW